VVFWMCSRGIVWLMLIVGGCFVVILCVNVVMNEL